jgi:hypothetical protein
MSIELSKIKIGDPVAFQEDNGEIVRGIVERAFPDRGWRILVKWDDGHASSAVSLDSASLISVGEQKR